MADLQSNRLGAYLAPRWSSEPIPEDVLELRFEVIREGVALDSDQHIALDKGAFTILGRQPDICHQTLLHPSISRQHAVVQHGPQGAVFIYDMGSTHGTKLNKTSLSAGQFVPLRVGDVVQFGLSTRLYCVEGPERLRPAEWQSMHGPLAVPRPTPSVLAPDPVDSDSDAVDSDDEVEIEDLDQYLVQGTAQFATLSLKQQKFVADLNKKRTRLSHIVKDTDTLQHKESVNGPLSKGQQKQLTRCLEVMTTLQSEVDQLTEELIARLKEKRKSRRRAHQPGNAAVKRRRAAESDEDDEFYNRTLAQTDTAVKQPTRRRRAIETYDSLKSKLASLNDRSAQLEDQIEALQRQTANTAATTTDDELDRFMSGISRDDVAQKLSIAMRQRTNLEAERKQIKSLIKIVTPAGTHLLPNQDNTGVSDSVA